MHSVWYASKLVLELATRVILHKFTFACLCTKHGKQLQCVSQSHGMSTKWFDHSKGDVHPFMAYGTFLTVGIMPVESHETMKRWLRETACKSSGRGRNLGPLLYTRLQMAEVKEIYEKL